MLGGTFLATRASRWFAWAGVICVVLLFLFSTFATVAVLKVVVPLIGIGLGCVFGWIFGETFIKSDLPGKITTGTLTGIPAGLTQFDTTKAFIARFLATIIPLGADGVQIALSWLTLALVVMFLISAAVNRPPDRA
jgi:hypothetical protein